MRRQGEPELVPPRRAALAGLIPGCPQRRPPVAHAEVGQERLRGREAMGELSRLGDIGLDPESCSS
jgi:hypothetical protein